MFAITGITGNVGGNVARNLLAGWRPVRAVMRDVRKGDGWAERGCELATADILDVSALASAFEGAEGVFVLVSAELHPAPSFAEARATAATLKSAIERAVRQSRIPVDDRRASGRTKPAYTAHSSSSKCWESCRCPLSSCDRMVHGKFRWDVAAARENGVIRAFCSLLINRTNGCHRRRRTCGREVLQGLWNGRRVVELEGPRRVTPDEVAATFAELLGRPVRMDAVPREDLGTPIQIAGHEESHTPYSDAGWLQRRLDRVREREASSRKGEVALKTVLQMLIEREGQATSR